MSQRRLLATSLVLLVVGCHADVVVAVRDGGATPFDGGRRDAAAPPPARDAALFDAGAECVCTPMSIEEPDSTACAAEASLLCVPTAAGCAWALLSCPAAAPCPDGACGATPSMTVCMGEDGAATGRCVRVPAGECAWEWMTCDGP